MKDFVSSRWVAVVGLTVSLSVLASLAVQYGLYGLLGTGLAFAGLGLSVATLLSRKPGRTVWQVIDEVEAEPVFVPLPIPGRPMGRREPKIGAR